MTKYRKAVFAVVYSREGEKFKYLVLHRKLHWKGWEFPKGGVERGESLIKTVKREVKEETGLAILKIKNLGISGKYHYEKELKDRPGIVGQSYVLFAVEVKKGKVKLDSIENDKFRWMEFKEAYKKLTWKNQKKSLRIVNNFLKVN